MEKEQAILNAKVMNTHLTGESVGLSYILNNKGEVMYLGDMPFDQNTVFTITSVMGVDSWEAVPGTYFRIKVEFQEDVAKIIAIGNILDDAWIELNSNDSQD